MDKYEYRRLRLIDLIVDKYDGVDAGLARALGIEPSYVSRMRYPEGKKGKKRIGEDMAEKIMLLHPEWLKSNDDKKQLHKTISYETMLEKIQKMGRVPLISHVAAGNWEIVVDNYAAGFADEFVLTTVPVRKHTYALRVKGDSMVAASGKYSFPDGCIIIVEPEKEAKNGDFVVVRQCEDEVTFKQLVIDAGQKLLMPLNPRYPVMALMPDAVICGVVLQMISDILR